MHLQEERDSEEFKTNDLVDVNSGLWYGVPIFTFWQDQVEKGVMPEPDMNTTTLASTRHMEIPSK